MSIPVLLNISEQFWHWYSDWSQNLCVFCHGELYYMVELPIQYGEWVSMEIIKLYH